VKKSVLVVCAAATGALFVGGGVAHAHIGANTAVAKFTNPPDPNVMRGDPNDTVPGFAWVSADQSFTIKWDDGDSDPTGRFTFYYMDHHPNYEVTADDIEAGLATKIENDAVNASGGYFASCYCEGDQGVTCPTMDDMGTPIVRSPTGNCANQLVWNTSALPPGTYWLVTVNNDPPFHVAYSSIAPVRISHGGTPLPAVFVMRPDGFGSWDQSYHMQWLADGKAPLTFDLAYGLEDTGAATATPTPLATGLQLTAGSDGTYTYDFDTSQLQTNKAYWVRIKATDADGNSTFTDSHYGITISHAGATTPPPDLAMAPPKKSGCELGPDDGGSGARGRGALLAVLGALALAYFVARRAARRG
jgi:hypothetical protein